MPEKTNLIVEIKREGKRLNAYEIITGRLVPESEAHIHYVTRKDAVEKGLLLSQFPSKAKDGDGKSFWRRIKKDAVPDYYKDTNVAKKKDNVKSKDPAVTIIRNKVRDAMKSKPADLFLAELHWRFLVRSYLRGRNILLKGYTGCGKTMSAYYLAEAMGKEIGRDAFIINMGATQDPRATLIGNTHYDSKKGTFFSDSEFVKAIQVEHSIVVLDELSRANPEAENILMSPLDYKQRFLRLDEAVDAPTIKVAEGVTFVATANVGAEFTATRRIDRALYDRFTAQIEIPVLDFANESKLLKQYFPTLRKDICEAIADVACYTRDNVKSEEPTVSTMISTRADVEIASMILDGFKYTESMQVAVYPLFDPEGGTESERTFVKQKVQQYQHLDDIADPEVDDVPEPEVEVEPEKEEKPDKNFNFEEDDELFDINDTF